MFACGEPAWPQVALRCVLKRAFSIGRKWLSRHWQHWNKNHNWAGKYLLWANRSVQVKIFFLWVTGPRGGKLFFALWKKTVVALTPWLKALPACGAIIPTSYLPLLSVVAPSFCIFSVPAHFLHPRYPSLLNNLGEWKQTKAANMARGTFCLCASQWNRSGEEGRGEGWRGWQARGRLLISKCGLCSMFSVAHPTRWRDKCVGLPGAGWCHKVERWLIFQIEKGKNRQKKKRTTKKRKIKNVFSYGWQFYVWGVWTKENRVTS